MERLSHSIMKEEATSPICRLHFRRGSKKTWSTLHLICFISTDTTYASFPSWTARPFWRNCFRRSIRDLPCGSANTSKEEEAKSSQKRASSELREWFRNYVLHPTPPGAVTHG